MSDSEVSTDEEGLGVEYTVHNPMTKWNLMRPILGERYENREQLKFALTNYAVANGYPLRFTRSDSKRIRVKCGKSQDGKTCPFFLSASRVGNERLFQIKTLVGKHICIRTNDRGSIVTRDWIAKHYMKELIARPNMKLKEIKFDLENKFSCNVSIFRCHRAKKRAQELIAGKLGTKPLLLEENGVKRKRRVCEKDDKCPTGRVRTCKNCLEEGHNVRSCKNMSQVLPLKEKKKVGRPRTADQGGSNRRRGRSVRGARGGPSGTMEEEKSEKPIEVENNKLHVEELLMEETMKVPMSMNTVIDISEDDDEGAHETQTAINDLRESGYTKDETDAIISDVHSQDDDGPDIEDTPLHGDAPIEEQDDDDEGIKDDEWIEETQPPVVIKGIKGRRRPSERIIKIKLGKKIDGKGSALGTPIDIE